MIDCNIDLKIEGNDQSGYHLMMSPEGFFTADSWHPTLEEAIINAYELFGITKEDWV
jgi:hypothetical protein